jgi:cation transport ATPase
MKAATTEINANPRKRRDLLRTWSAVWLWCIPLLIVIAASNLYNGHRLSFSMAGILLTVATLWIGAACYVNGRHCGRLHCKIDGILLPLLSLAGLLNLLHTTIFTFSWAAYTNVLAVIVVLSYVAEWLNNRRNERGKAN